MDPLSSISPRSPALSYLDIIHHFCGRLVDGYGYGNGGYEKGVVGVMVTRFMRGGGETEVLIEKLNNIEIFPGSREKFIQSLL